MTDILRSAHHHEVIAIIEREKREIPNRPNAEKVRLDSNRLPHDVRITERDLPNMREETEE